MHRDADPHALLALWEAALPLPAPQREALLAGDGGPAAATLGAQRRRLLERLREHAGECIALRCRCAACGETVGFEVGLGALLAALPAAGSAHVQRLEHGAWRLQFRLPAPHDLQALADEPDVDRFARALLKRCVLEAREGGQARGGDELPADLCEQLSARMEVLDAAASLGFDVVCPACGQAWSAPFDPAAALWSLVQTRAERLLLEVDTLARRYGWREDEVLALTPMRRQAYLQFARAD